MKVWKSVTNKKMFFSIRLEGLSEVDIVSPQLISSLEHRNSDSNSDREEINIEEIEEEERDMFDLFDLMYISSVRNSFVFYFLYFPLVL